MCWYSSDSSLKALVMSFFPYDWFRSLASTQKKGVQTSAAGFPALIVFGCWFSGSSGHFICCDLAHLQSIRVQIIPELTIESFMDCASPFSWAPSRGGTKSSLLSLFLGHPGLPVQVRWPGAFIQQFIYVHCDSKSIPWVAQKHSDARSGFRIERK